MRYDKEEIKEYWAKIQKYIKTIRGNLIKMRRTDDNGDIAQNETCNLIGKWAIAKTNEKGNGENYYKTIVENNLSCMDTFFIPPERKTQSPATWNNYDGAQNKQIDLYAISNKIKTG